MSSTPAAVFRAAMQSKARDRVMEADIAESGVAAEELKQFVERIERLEEEKKAIADDIRDVYAELKGRGFDTKAVRQIVKIRKQDHAERKELEAILDLYMQALNMS
jgi:uncharacterized protein (UPF0335 family)